jgi:hypothetical protein
VVCGVGFADTAEPTVKFVEQHCEGRLVLRQGRDAVQERTKFGSLVGLGAPYLFSGAPLRSHDSLRLLSWACVS